MKLSRYVRLFWDIVAEGYAPVAARTLIVRAYGLDAQQQALFTVLTQTAPARAHGRGRRAVH